MFDILSIIPGKKKSTGAGWTSFNCVCCSHLGHRPDRRSRAGIKFEGQTEWKYHCFNCGYSCGFTLGKTISPRTKNMLVWCGVDEEQVQRWSLESLSHKDLLDFTTPTWNKSKITFEERGLYPGGELLSEDKAHHKKYVDYLRGRKIAVKDYPFIVTPNAQGRARDRIVIPFTFRDKIVGHTSRYLDNKHPKYINDQQPGYVFGYDFQQSNWEACIVVEGVFDAISVNGCALLHNTISDEQAKLLAQFNRRIIVVPDRDDAGLAICERALSLGYFVSLPNWAPDVKDPHDAVAKYGKLPTVMSILQSATMSKIKIEMQRNKIVKNRSTQNN